MNRLGALHERQFRLLWLGQTASAIGDSVIYVALPFAVIQIGGGAAELGLVLASFTLARASFIVVGGVWADRLPRRLVMLACDAIRAAVQASVAVTLLTGVMEIWMFVVTAALVGAALLIAVLCLAVLPLKGVRGPTLARPVASGSAGGWPVPAPPDPLP